MFIPPDGESSIKDSLNHLEHIIDTHKKDPGPVQCALKGVISELKKSSAEDFKSLNVGKIRDLIGRIESLDTLHENEKTVFQKAIRLFGWENNCDLSEDLEEISSILDEKIRDSVNEFLENKEYSKAIKAVGMMEPEEKRDNLCVLIGINALEDEKYSESIKAAAMMKPGKEKEDFLKIIQKLVNGKYLEAVEVAKMMKPGKEKEKLLVIIGIGALRSDVLNNFYQSRCAAEKMEPGKNKEDFLEIIQELEDGKYIEASCVAEKMEPGENREKFLVIIGMKALESNDFNNYYNAIFIAEKMEPGEKRDDLCVVIGTKAWKGKEPVWARTAAAAMSPGKKKADFQRNFRYT